jgi:hypothetical protein
MHFNGDIIPARAGSEYVDRSAVSGNTYWYRLGAVADDGEWMSQLALITAPKAALALHQYVPNPFKPTMEITYGIPVTAETSRVVVDVSDVLGLHVRSIVNRDEGRGEYRVTWDGKDDQGREAASREKGWAAPLDLAARRKIGVALGKTAC